MILNITQKEFKEVVLNSKKPVLVNFYADWCRPCQRFAPTLEEFANEISDQAVIARINLDENMDLGVQYEVLSIPTIIIFNKGQVTNRVGGAQNKSNMKKLLDIL